MKNLILSFCLILCARLNAQTPLFGGNTGNGNFESGTSGWVLVNGSQANKWVVGTNATPGFTGNGIYISSSATAPYLHQYTTSSASYSYFYKDVAIPAGSKTVWLVFDYISNGHAVTDAFGTEAKDAMRIWARNPSSSVTAGQELDNIFISAAAGYYNQATMKKREVRYLDATGYAGSTMRVVFQWFNDNSLGNQPPAGLDNIEMYASCQEFIFPSQSSSNYGGNYSVINWYAVTGATGYEIRYRKVDDPVTVPTYTNPITVAGGGTTSYNLTGLTPSTTYMVEVKPVGTACADYSPHALVTTLNTPGNDDCTGAAALAVGTNACTGTTGTFLGATTSSTPATACAFSSNPDVWYSLTAQNAKQYIQTMPVNVEDDYSAKTISIYSGNCGSLTLVTQPCATESYSTAYQRMVTKFIADGLTPGTTYYVRVSSSSSSSTSAFSICAFNEPSPAGCSNLLSPANGSVLNYGLPQTFTWSKATNAVGYRLRIIEQSGGYTEIHTSDTFHVFAPAAGINYTWNVMPFTISNTGTTCIGLAFSTCAAALNPLTISTLSPTAKCANDSVKIKTSASGSSVQWFLDNQAIAGATGDSIWAIAAGSYSVRIVNGACYSNASNIIDITNKATPSKPTLTIAGPLTFCSGGSVLLGSAGDATNAWYRNGIVLTGGPFGTSYTATQSGEYYVRVFHAVSGCSANSDTVVVTVNPTPATPVVTASGPLSICEGVTLQLQSSATTGNQWSLNGSEINGATNQQLTITSQSGNYTVKVTVAGCTSLPSAATHVTVNPIPPVPTMTVTGNTTFCNGDSVRLQSSATGNQWFINNLGIVGGTGQVYYAKESGTFAVKAVANGCYSANSNSVDVTVNPLPTQPVITSVANVLSTGTGYTTYQWYFNNTIIAGAVNNQYTALQNGNYKVEVTGSNGCKASSVNFPFAAAALNEVVFTGTTIRVFPNPVQKKLSINVTGTLNANGFTGRLVDMNGKLLKIFRLKPGTNELEMHDVPNGTYLLMLSDGRLEKGIRVMKQP